MEKYNQDEKINPGWHIILQKQNAKLWSADQIKPLLDIPEYILIEICKTGPRWALGKCVSDLMNINTGEPVKM